MVYNVKIGLAPVYRDICTCATWVKSFWLNVLPDKLICLLVLNLKMFIIKLTRVSFGTPKGYMLQKCVPLSIRSWKPQPSYEWQDYFPSLCIFKACIPFILNFTKINLLKSYKKCFLFQLNCTFGSWNMEILEEN